MTEPTALTLDDVRARFLEAEARLGDAAAAIKSIETATERLASAREGLADAGQQLAGLAGSLGEVAAALTDNAQHLREGVDAIRLGDPAAIRRQIEELDSAFTALQAVLGDRLTAIEGSTAEASQEVTRLSGSARRERRILAAAILAAVVIGIVLQLLF